MVYIYLYYFIPSLLPSMAYVHAQEDNAGIKLSNDCLQKGTCNLSIYQTLKIRDDSPVNDAQTLMQDIFLGATFFIGTAAAIGFIVSGMIMAFGGADESMYEKGKKWFKYSVIGLLLVVFSYSLIRLIEYIAQGKT